MNQNSTNTTGMNSTYNHPANDLIEAVAFGFASEAEIQLVNEHVATCETCAEALQNARLAAQALPLSVVEMDAPDSLWAGIEQRIEASEAPPETTLSSPVQQPNPSSFKVPWAVAALLAVITLAGGIFLGRTVFETDAGPGPVPEVAVSITDPDISASGSVHYLADQGVIVLDLENLPPTPEGFVYQVWMIEGETPVSMGLFNPQSNRFAAAGNPSDFDLLAITVEEGPIGSDQPTTDPLVVADLEPLRDN